MIQLKKKKKLNVKLIKKIMEKKSTSKKGKYA